jgi:hypothetical protein
MRTDRNVAFRSALDELDVGLGPQREPPARGGHDLKIRTLGGGGAAGILPASWAGPSSVVRQARSTRSGGGALGRWTAVVRGARAAGDTPPADELASRAVIALQMIARWC